MYSDIQDYLIPILLALLLLFFVFRPETLRARTLQFLKDEPRTFEEIAIHLGINLFDTISILHYMMKTTEEVEKGFRSPWDNEGNKRDTEVYWLTAKGNKKLKTSLIVKLLATELPRRTR